MIDTDKEVKNILFDLGVEGNEYGDLVEYISNLLAEVERLNNKLLRSLQWVEDRYGYATTGDLATLPDFIKFIGSEEE
jgi:hypothetical protein